MGRERPLGFVEGVAVYGDSAFAPLVECARGLIPGLISGVWTEPDEAREVDLEVDGGCACLRVFRVGGGAFVATLGHPAPSLAFFESLTPRERQVFEQVFHYGRTHDEVATALGIAVGTVRNHLRGAAAKSARHGAPLPRRRHRSDPHGLDDRLTATETKIAHMAARGRRNAEIALELELSPVTIGCYVTRICRKLGVRGRTELAAKLAGLDRV